MGIMYIQLHDHGIIAALPNTREMGSFSPQDVMTSFHILQGGSNMETI